MHVQFFFNLYFHRIDHYTFFALKQNTNKLKELKITLILAFLTTNRI